MAGLRGALIAFTEAFPVPVPNVVVFQYNPDTMTHGWQVAEVEAGSDSPLAVPGPPKESFDFDLEMDAKDSIADGSPIVADLAEISGLYSRLAALAMLLFPLPAKGVHLIGPIPS